MSDKTEMNTFYRWPSDAERCTSCGAAADVGCECTWEDGPPGFINWSAECDKGNVDIMSGIPLAWWDGSK